MDYDIIHDQIIERARVRISEGYAEEHHVIPRCVGGTDEPNNLVLLTPEEHYVVHQLLVKMRRYKEHPNYNKLIFAANMMCVDSTTTARRGNRRYGWLKRRLSETIRETMTGRKQSAEQIEKRMAHVRGRKLSEETKRKISESKKAKKRAEFSETWKENMRIAQSKVSKKGIQHTPETRAKMSAAKKGKPCSPETAERLRKAASGRVVTEETRRRMADAARASWERKTPEEREQHRNKLKGHTVSEETRRKISLARKKDDADQQ
jgi:hypothetical protein